MGQVWGNFERGSVDQWREKIRARPGSVLAARGLARAIVNTIDPERKDPTAVEGLLGERGFRPAPDSRDLIAELVRKLNSEVT